MRAVASSVVPLALCGLAHAEIPQLSHLAKVNIPTIRIVVSGDSRTGIKLVASTSGITKGARSAPLRMQDKRDWESKLRAQIRARQILVKRATTRRALAKITTTSELAYPQQQILSLHAHNEGAL